jgi:Bacterial PH domain
VATQLRRRDLSEQLLSGERSLADNCHMFGGDTIRTAWRSKSQMWTAVAFGAFIALLGLGQFGRPASSGGGAGVAIVMLAIGGVGVGLFTRVALITDEDGIRIRNPLHTVAIPWQSIERFRIGRHGMLSAVCVIDLVGGESTYAFAIQVPRIRTPAKSKEQQQVDRLNRLLAEKRARR